MIKSVVIDIADNETFRGGSVCKAGSLSMPKWAFKRLEQLIKITNI